MWVCLHLTAQRYQSRHAIIIGYRFSSFASSMFKAAKIAFHHCSWRHYQGYSKIMCYAIQQQQDTEVVRDLEIMEPAWFKPCAPLLTRLRTISSTGLFLHLRPIISSEWTTDHWKIRSAFWSQNFLVIFKENLSIRKENACHFFSFLNILLWNDHWLQLSKYDFF